MVNTILARRVNHIVAKGGNPVWPKGSKSRGFSTLFDIDLLRYLELMRLEQYADMTLQENLDREDSYQIILLLGQDEHVISIQINQWIMVFNETEL